MRAQVCQPSDDLPKRDDSLSIERPPVHPGHLAPGEVFGAYRVDEVLGGGGMGVVYRAHEVALARQVALKVVAPRLLEDDWARMQFVREARLAASLEHPNVVPIYATGEHGGTAFLAMRYVDGHDLQMKVRHGGPLECRRAVALLAQIAAALDAAHREGLVHRDVKPANVLVTATDHAYLTDFGIAQHAPREGKRVKEAAGGPLHGTVGYLAPEVIAGAPADARADVYALGCLLFFTLTGRTPFDNPDPEAVLEGHLAAPPPLVSRSATAVPAELDRVIERALAKDPAQRYVSAGELAAAARAAVAAAAHAAAPDGDEPTITDERGPGAGSVPLPLALERHAAKPLFGRAAELELLTARWQTVVADGVLRCAVVGGEPGIGKTRVLAEVCGRAHADGATVLYGRCHEDSPFPYAPFVEAVDGYVAATSPERLRTLVGPGIAQIVARLLPQLARWVPGDAPALAADPESERLQLFEAITALMTGAARHAPVVVALDDLQWADQPTLRLVEHLTRTAAQSPILVLGTYRDTEAGEGHRLQETLARLRRDRMLEQLRIAGLQEAAIAELARASSHSTTPAALVRALFEQTAGNPYFVEEIMRELHDTAGGGSQPVADVLAEIGVPESVQDLIGRRVARLSEPARSIVAAASVVGPEFDVEVLALVTGTPEDPLIDALDEAAAVHVVTELPRAPGSYTFAHALVRDTLYRRLSATRRARLHGRVGHAIEQVYAGDLDHHLPALARHHDLAGDVERALRYHALAGDAAMRVHGLDHALDHYTRALDAAAQLGHGLSDPVVYGIHHRRAELRQRAGDLCGALEDAEAAITGARRAGDARSEIDALNYCGAIRRSQDFEGAIADHEAALRVAQDAGDARAQVATVARLSIVYSNQLRLDDAVQFGDRALRIARDLEDDHAVAVALDAVKLAALQIGHLEVLEEATARLLELHHQAGDDWGLHWVADWVLLERAFIPIAAARWEEGVEAVHEALRANRRLRNRFGEPLFLDAVGWLHRSQGDHDRAIAAGSEAVSLAQMLEHPEWSAWTNATLGWTLLEAGDAARAAEHLERGLAAAEASGAGAQLLRCTALLASAAWELGERDRALESADRAEALLARVRAPPGRMFLFGAHAPLAVARVRLAAGAPQRARQLVAPVLAAARAAGWLETIAYASVLDGCCCVARDSREAGTAAIEEGLELARAAGLGWVQRQAQAKLAEVTAAHR